MEEYSDPDENMEELNCFGKRKFESKPYVFWKEM
jgi:hypothetical protein